MRRLLRAQGEDADDQDDRRGERTGAAVTEVDRDLGAVVFFYAFGLFKTAVVAQQIYYRYAKGLTQDARFAAFLHGVRVLTDQARAAIARGTI